jgi:hypothetical protein
MSHEDAYEHPIQKHNPEEGFDRSEPNTPAIWAFTIGSVAVLVLTIAAVAGYFDSLYQEAVYRKVLSAPSSQLLELRNRDAWNLHHYMYGDLDRKSGRVRIPVDQAMDAFAQEAQAGKLFYPAKATPIKKEEPAAAPAGASAK